MDLVKMTIFTFETIIENALVLFMMIGMPVLINGIMLTTQGRVGCTAKTVAFNIQREYEVRRINCAVYPRKMLRFRNGAKENEKKRRNDRVIYEVPAGLFTERRRRAEVPTIHAGAAAHF